MILTNHIASFIIQLIRARLYMKNTILLKIKVILAVPFNSDKKNPDPDSYLFARPIKGLNEVRLKQEINSERVLYFIFLLRDVI